jgi:hypothetical protein
VRKLAADIFESLICTSATAAAVQPFSRPALVYQPLGGYQR